MAARAISLDMSNVSEGGSEYNPRQLPEGDYLARITAVKDGEAKSDKGAMWIFTIVPEQHRSAKYPYYCKLQENQLWKVRNILVAAGIAVPKKKVKVDPERVVGKLIAISLEDDEYEGKMKSTIAAIFPAAELQGDNGADVPEDDDEGDEDESTTAAAADDDDEDEAGDAFEEMDRAALKAYIIAAQPDFKAKKSQTDDELRELARAITATDDAEVEDEEEEDEEPTPPPVKKATKKVAAKAAVDDDDLEELDIDEV